MPNCDKFDELVSKRCLVLPNFSVSILKNKRIQNILDSRCSRDPQAREPPNSWFIHGTIGDFYRYPNFKKKLYSRGFTTADVIAKQSRITQNTINAIRERICGKML